MRALVVILREGSLNRAAAQLRTSQSALSRQVQALEAEIGGALLERTSTGVKATAAGYALAGSMDCVLEQYDAAIADARRLVRGQHDRLRIGYLASAAQSFLNPALAALRRRHPEVNVKLLDLSPGEQLAALRSGEIDVALIGQEGCLAGREFYTRKLTAMPMMAFLPADHRLAKRGQIELKELRGETFTASSEEDLPGRDRWVGQLCRRAGFRARFGPMAETLSQAFTLVSGEGDVFIAPAYLESVSVPGVKGVLLADKGVIWDLLVAWQRGHTAGSLRVLLEELSAAAAAVCWKPKANVGRSRPRKTKGNKQRRRTMT